MRIATANNYDSTIKVLADRQAQLAQQQERLATGKRVLRASDDPVAATLSEAARNPAVPRRSRPACSGSVAHQPAAGRERPG